MDSGTDKSGCRKPASILVIGLVLACVIVLGLGLCVLTTLPKMAFLGSGEEAAPMEPAPSSIPLTSGSTPTMPSEAEETASAPEEAVESSEDTAITADTQVGEFNLSYPIWMRPGTSDSVLFTVIIPAEYAALQVEEFSRTDIAPQSVPAIGAIGSDNGTIYIDGRIRVELDSLTFQVQPEYPALQSVDLTPNTPTYWAWSLLAPVEEGFHRINVKVYLDETSDNPSWFGTYQIEILLPTPTPVPTPRPTIPPTPTQTVSQRVGDQVIDNFGDILAALIPTLIAIAAALGGFVIKPFRRRGRISELKSSMYTAETEQEIASLTSEIQHLKAIRWWQFWK